MATPKLHADDTPVPVLDPGRGKTKTGRLWTYVRDDRPAGSEDPPAVLFRYSPDRRGERPREHLKRFAGILQADAYSGFSALYEGDRVKEAACWAHARRAFYDLHQANASPIAAEALERIGKLYEIEAEIRGRPPDERKAIRQAREGPLLESLREWLRETLARTSKKSDLAAAISYVLMRWTALTRYRDDGRHRDRQQRRRAGAARDREVAFIVHPLFKCPRTLGFGFRVRRDAGHLFPRARR